MFSHHVDNQALIVSNSKTGGLLFKQTKGSASLTQLLSVQPDAGCLLTCFQGHAFERWKMRENEHSSILFISVTLPASEGNTTG